MKYFQHAFKVFAKWTARITGKPIAFVLALMVIIVWAISGPIFGYSDTWQLVINTGTTVVTFLMVFLIQNTQNRDTGAMQAKLDELIRAIEGAHNALLDLEELDESEIEQIRSDYEDLAEEARQSLKTGGRDTDCGDVQHRTADEKKTHRKKR
jgi:low affinity Fe/Cu permease